MTRTDEQLLAFDPFDGDRDVDIKMRECRIVMVRKPHQCWEGQNADQKSGPHEIKPGERARYEKALVDGKWGSFYVCIPCLNNALDMYVDNQPEAAEA